MSRIGTSTPLFGRLLMPALLLAASAHAAATWGNLSVGKFYVSTTAPSKPYQDRFPVSIPNGPLLSDGIKLTDEAVTSTGPLDGSWVGWWAATNSVTVDLGSVYAVSDINVHAASQTAWGIFFPEGATVAYSLDGVSFVPYATLHFPPDTSGFSRAFATASGWVNARYLKVTTPGVANQWVFLNEITVNGSIPNTPKQVPSSGCYHGGYRETPEGWLNISEFEKRTNHDVVLALWYGDWSRPFVDTIGETIDGIYARDGKDPENARLIYPELGWLPYYATSTSIANGRYDAYLYAWFSAAGEKGYPLWLRPMNEMNGPWTWPNNGSPLEYGGDPASFKRAWRRMYNIAEKAGATGPATVFVWSPDVAADYGSAAGSLNDMTLYFPGDQYVDWVGGSVYSDGSRSFSTLVQRWYGLYSNKPMMISEGGASENPTNPSWKSDFISAWFTETRLLYPQIKALVWYDKGQYSLDSSNQSLLQYQTSVQHPYFVGRK